MSRAYRTNPEIRKAQILDAAIKLSTKIGYKSITRDAVADIVGISSALIANYFPRMLNLRKTILETAIEKEIVEIVAQGITINDPLTSKISNRLKQKVTDYIFKKGK